MGIRCWSKNTLKPPELSWMNRDAPFGEGGVLQVYHHGMEEFRIEGGCPRVRALVERLPTLYISDVR